MEPAAELQNQQQSDYAKKVNEMQKLLPCLEQRIANATLQNGKDEELQKWKLLHQVLCSGQVPAVSDSLTLEDLDKYAVMLRDAENMATKITLENSVKMNNDNNRQFTKENITTNGNITDINSKDQKAMETVEKANTITNSNKGETKVPEIPEKKQKLEDEEKADKEDSCEANAKVQKKEEEGTKNQNGTLETGTSGVNLQSNTLSKDSTTATPDAANNSASWNEKSENDTLNNEEGGKKSNENVPQAVDKTQQVAEDAHNNFEPPDDLEEIEYEGIELIKIPEETAEDEMILPDSADEADFTLHVSEDEEETDDDEPVEGQQEEEAEREDEEQRVVGEEGREIEQVVRKKGEVQKNVEEAAAEEDEDENMESNKNEVEKTIPTSNVVIEDSVNSVESVSVQEQEETTQASDSSSRKAADDDNKNTNENDNDTSDAEIDATQNIIEEESHSLPAELTVDMESESGNAHDDSNNECDDPLGQVEHVQETTDESQEKSVENEGSNKTTKERQISQTQVEVAKNKPTGNEGHKKVDDDDDDVEIIESRDSPICLDTDDEDVTEVGTSKIADKDLQITTVTSDNSQTNTRIVITTNKPLPTLDHSAAKTGTRTGIVKTSKPTTETIDLLDSSDEEGNTNTKKTKRATNTRYTLTKSLVRLPTTANQLSTRGRKRTLLPTMQTQKPLKISQVLSGAAVPANCRAYSSTTSSKATAQQSTNMQATKSPKSVLVFPPTSFKPTPQSNFLNAVNLLPTAATTGDNPLAFSATLWNKNIIIPNAFYATRRTTAKEVAETEQEATTTTNKPSAATFTSTLAAATSSTSSTSTGAASKATSKVQTITVTQQQERVYREWLDLFIENFANPQQIASHSCLVLLQSALKYKSFARIKDLRTTLNTKAYTSNNIADGQLTRELQNNFYTPDCRLTSEGFRFCAAACTQIGNNVTLMTDARTGRITVRTCPFDELLAKFGSNNGGGVGGAGGGVGSGGMSYDVKGKRNKVDEEYTPAKYYEKKVEQKSGERRKSLRQHRTRCYDETYLYEHVETDADEPLVNVARPAGGTFMSSKRRQEMQMLDLVQRKAEEKRLEAKRQREQQVKSFESAYLEMFANTMRGKNMNGKSATMSASTTDSGESATSSRRSTDATTNNTQIIIDDDDDEACLEDGEPRSHRIYKVVPTRLVAASSAKHHGQEDKEEPENILYDDVEPQPAKGKRGRPRKQDLSVMKKSQKNTNEPELITCDSTSGDSFSVDEQNFGADENVPKNVNVNWHSGTDWCRICNVRIPRTVVHHVNEHPNYEVYTSRIQKNHLARLRKQGGQLLQMRPYMNGQEQYAAECVFCNKTCCFKIPYWYQHYSMHTGEYAYRCSGCNARKPTRSAMMVHINQPCRKRGKLIEDYTYNARAKYIDVRICKLCNFTQLNQRNVLKHLRTQHGAAHMQIKNIESIVLLRMPEPEVEEMLEDAKEFMDLSSGGEENSNEMAMTFNYDNFDNVAQLGGGGMWDDGDPTDDLSYMICGMLDVEMRNDDK